MYRPTLTIDLSGEDGNVFRVIVLVMDHLTGERLEQFKHDISAARQPGASKEYKDILEIVNSYVRLIDTSGTHPEYAWNETAIIAAIDRLDAQLKTLPDTTCCLTSELYPDFNSSECGPESYLALVEEEIKRVETDGDTDPDSDKKLLTMLRECVAALKEAGV